MPILIHIECPACGRLMPARKVCANCGHEDDGFCTCDHCLMCEEDSDDE